MTDPDYLALLDRTCTVEAYGGAGATGPVYAAPVVEACRYEDVRELVTDGQGREVTATGLLFLPATSAVNAEARVTVDGRVTTAITVSKFDDEATVHHVEARLR